jgi:hypothetical protein
MNMTAGAVADGSGDRRATSVLTGVLDVAPKRMLTEYVVQDRTAAGLADAAVAEGELEPVEALAPAVGALGPEVEALAVVEVGELDAGVLVVVAGEGETIAAGVADALAGVVVAVVVADEAVVVDDEVLDVDGLVASFGVVAANGLRGSSARSCLTCAGSSLVGTASGVVLAVDGAGRADAAGGAGTVGVSASPPRLSSNSGRATMATTRSATSTHSRRSMRSRRMALMVSLPSCSRRG